jgi:glycogen operon protein
MGDEVGRTQRGNNNTYCQDNELNWLDWSLKERNAELFRFCQGLIAFRKAHPVVRQPRFAATWSGATGRLEISWHGTRAWAADWSASSRVLAMLARLRGGSPEDDDVVYAAFNMYWEALSFEVPALENGRSWHVVANTGVEPPADVFVPGTEPPLENPQQLLVGGRSVVILVAG